MSERRQQPNSLLRVQYLLTRPTAYVPLIAGIAFLASVCFVWAYRAGKDSRSRRTREPVMQCAHYATQRVSELLGVPLSERQVLSLLKPNARGHSFAEIEAALTAIGLKGEGFSEDWKSLMAGPFPCIVQLRNPDHFVVLTRTESKRVVLFDDMGRRRVAPVATIQQRWSGAVLRISRPDPGPALAGASLNKVPLAVFSTLIADAGEVKQGVEMIEFKFPLANRGSAPLQVMKVDVSCNCLSVTRPEIIEPGKQGTIVLKYSPDRAGPAGLVAQEARVMTNDSRLPLVRLTALASLESRVHLLPAELLFPKTLADEVARGYTAAFYAGDHPEELTLSPAADLPVGVGCRIISYEEFVAVVGAKGVFAKPVEPDRERFIQVTIDGNAIERSNGRFRGMVRLRSGMPHVGDIVIPYSGSIVSPVEARPRMVAFVDDAQGLVGDALGIVHLHSKSKYTVKSISEGTFLAKPAERPSGRPGHELELQVSLPVSRARELHSNQIGVTLVNDETHRESVLELQAYYVPRP